MSLGKILITGAAGLVGQNLIAILNLKQDDINQPKTRCEIVAIDKNSANLNILKELHPDIKCLNLDLKNQGSWEVELKDISCVVILHAHITGLKKQDFVDNNITATENLLNACKKYNIPKVIHVSSSVVNSVAEDFYTETKLEQEKMVANSGIPYTILRPTLMFGWFDPKHLGWLSRFMQKTPIFPIPGRGEFIRQPLYAKDFSRVIISLIQSEARNEAFDIVGEEDITYIDLITKIKKLVNSKTLIFPLPYSAFSLLLKSYALFFKNPPFTADQLKALVAGDYFTGVSIEKTFAVKPTPIREALVETFCHPSFSKVVLEKT
jgi:nucleoside-diphosphate-sugar epimerase